MTKLAKVALTFSVDEDGEKEVRRRFAKLVQDGLFGGEEDLVHHDDLAAIIAEVLLNSNPDIEAYLDYGIELMWTETSNMEVES